MNPVLWIAIAVFVASALLLIVALAASNDDLKFLAGMSAVIALVLALIMGVWGAMPQWNLYRASIEKRILVEEAIAQADAATELARAEIARAEGVAQSNLIVAESITEQYLRYLYIDQLDQIQGQVIYIPTEAGLPILEAGRLAPGGE